jgi:murein L,D-transpeptidase YafK
VLELWARRDSREPFRRVAEYPFCATSGELGPKRREGDGQIPEGFYLVDRFNPASRFHLSLGLNYPNASDRRRGLPGQLGGDIFIHGGCATIGCIPLTDAGIEDIYLAAVEAVGSGQAAVPAHIFPARLDEAGYARLHEHFTGRPDLLGFWREIRPAFLFFEAHRRLPRIGVDSEGRYRIQP